VAFANALQLEVRHFRNSLTAKVLARYCSLNFI